MLQSRHRAGAASDGIRGKLSFVGVMAKEKASVRTSMLSRAV
jgi:hypothetical protein